MTALAATLAGIESGDHTFSFQVSCTVNDKNVVDINNPSKTAKIS